MRSRILELPKGLRLFAKKHKIRKREFELNYSEQYRGEYLSLMMKRFLPIIGIIAIASYIIGGFGNKKASNKRRFGGRACHLC